MWPFKRRARQDEASRADGWANVATGIGQHGRDKLLYATFRADRLTPEQCEEIYRGDDFAATIVDLPAGEKTRAGWDLQVGSESDKDKALAISKSVAAKLDALDMKDKFAQALAREGYLGGAAIFPGVNDGAADLAEPLDLTRIQTVLPWAHVLRPQDLRAVSWYQDVQSPKLGEPEMYELQPRIGGGPVSRVRIHESRLIVFPGIVISPEQLRENGGWGDSKYVRIQRVLSAYHQTWSSAAVLLSDFAAAVMKVPGLAKLLAAGKEKEIVEYARTIDLTRSVARMSLVDAEGDFERKATPMSGYPEMLVQFALRLAAAARMPVSLLMGQSPAGLNATGDANVRFWYDRMAAEQPRVQLNRMTQLVLCAKDGPTRGVEPEEWTQVFRPLWQMTARETAELRKLVAERDAIDIDRGVVTPEEVAASRYGGSEWSMETTIDLEARQAMAAERVKAEARLKLAPPPPGPETPDEPAVE